VTMKPYCYRTKVQTDRTGRKDNESPGASPEPGDPHRFRPCSTMELAGMRRLEAREVAPTREGIRLARKSGTSGLTKPADKII
jgi:hypothetical protein